MPEAVVRAVPGVTDVDAALQQQGVEPIPALISEILINYITITDLYLPNILIQLHKSTEML